MGEGRKLTIAILEYVLIQSQLSQAALAEKKEKKNCSLLKLIMEQKSYSVVKKQEQQIPHEPHCALALVKGINGSHEA